MLICRYWARRLWERWFGVSVISPKSLFRSIGQTPQALYRLAPLLHRGFGRGSKGRGGMRGLTARRAVFPYR